MSTYATFVTSHGEIKCRLYPDHAPETVENFIGLATGKKEWTDPESGKARKDALYNGTIFHRVIPGFMIQGGDPTGTGRGDPGYRFDDEIDGAFNFATPGKLAMANAGPNTNGCQFFITVAATTHLNGKHTIFGDVVDGYDNAIAISELDSDGQDRPNDEVTITEIKITEED